MRSDANLIALKAIRAILKSAHPFELTVDGKLVTCSVAPGNEMPWPQIDGLSGEADGPWPSDVTVNASWNQGGTTLTVGCDYWKTAGRYRHLLGLRVRLAKRPRELVWITVPRYLRNAEDGYAAPLQGATSTVKRKVEGAANLSRVVNDALRDLLRSSGLPMASASTAEICRIVVPTGAIEPSPEVAFRRLVHLALLKMDFLDRGRPSTEGPPLIDVVARLGENAGQLDDVGPLEQEDEDEDNEEDVQARIRDRLEKAIPVASERRAALELIAYGIESADDERANAWRVRQSGHGLALFAGRMLACRIGRSKAELSVMGPVPDEVRAILGADAEETEEWRAVPGALLVSFPVQKAASALELLKDAFDRFIDEAMARVRRKINMERHVPETVAYVASVVGRDLPQPSNEDDPVDDADDEDDTVVSRDPKVRGRAPIFNHAQMSIASLLGDIDEKSLALPDLQRPFVWEDTKVRDLLDSLFVGFPVGTLVLWHTADGKEARALGGPDALKATTLIIDGQQRLTSLYAVMRGAHITERDGTKRRIRIAFRPRDGRFEVADAATDNDPEFLPNVGELWSKGRTKGQIRRGLLNFLRDKGRNVDAAYENAVEENLDRAQALSDYQFPVVRIQKAAGADEANEEDVAEIFVRINNQGKRLGQADFVLTLLAVFHGSLRDKIEVRAAEMSQGAVLEVDTQQLLRASCAVGFSRARMSAIYRYLRGVDPVTGDTNLADRQQRLEVLDRAATDCINPTTWRDFMLRVVHAGVVSPSLIAANNAIINAYAFYVLGRRMGVPKPRLDKLASRWVFGTLLSARYTSGSEAMFEQDLARLEALNLEDPEAFVATLDQALAERITGDYWTHSLVAALETQRGRAPAALAFRSSQVILGARALFSDQPLQNLLAPPAKGRRAASEAHHLFPQAWLKSQGITDRRRINQVANFADVGWYENNVIQGDSPAKYVPRIREQLRLDDARWGRACAEHALPPNWQNLDYETFLRERRQRMADIIHVAFRQLGGEADAPPVTPPWFLPGAEQVWSRIADTERGLRALVRDVYVKRFGGSAAQKIEDSIPAGNREPLTRALRARPRGADPLSILDYLYLGQLPPLLFISEVWPEAKLRLGSSDDAKQRLQTAIQHIVPVRNEIAHVREIAPERLQKANVACNDILAMLVTQ